MSVRRTKTKLFGQAVRKLRENLGISQEGLAARIEIHRTYLGGVERGERNPTLITILRIAKALEVKPSVLFASLDDHD